MNETAFRPAAPKQSSAMDSQLSVTRILSIDIDSFDYHKAYRMLISLFIDIVLNVLQLYQCYQLLFY